MPDKLEVLPGPGLVARFGDLAVWAGPQASPALQAHLVTEAQRLAGSPQCGDQLASSFISILQRGDPEPQAPFAVVGPGANGLTLFLHGPVQAWDSGRWLAPQPVPGWMVAPIGRPWPLIVLPYGAPPPPQSPPGNPFDLRSGTVPGAGFVMLRPAAPPTPAPSASVGPAVAGADHAQGTTTAYGGPGYVAGPTAQAPVPQAPGPAPTSPVLAPSPQATAGPQAGPVGAATGQLAPVQGGFPSQGGGPGQGGGPTTSPGPVPSAPPGPELPATPPSAGNPNLVDLRSVLPAGTGPLSQAGAVTGAAADRPQVVGLRCEEGHMNHPRSATCALCGRSLSGLAQVSGPRPSLGVLLADDGSVWSLERTCLIGSEAGSSPEARSGTAQAITMLAGNNHMMAPVHCEVQVRDWGVYLVDRGAEGGTSVQAPGGPGWALLARHEQRELATGSHLSCGGRVFTYLAAWPG